MKEKIPPDKLPADLQIVVCKHAAFLSLAAGVSGPFHSLMRPSSMCTTRSAICASSRLWVIITRV